MADKIDPVSEPFADFECSSAPLASLASLASVADVDPDSEPVDLNLTTGPACSEPSFASMADLVKKSHPFGDLNSWDSVSELSLDSVAWLVSGDDFISDSDPVDSVVDVDCSSGLAFACSPDPVDASDFDWVSGIDLDSSFAVLSDCVVESVSGEDLDSVSGLEFEWSAPDS